MHNLGFTWLDVVAVFWFFLGWIGYARVAVWHSRRVPSLQSMMQL